MPMHTAAIIPFLFATPIVWLLLPATQAQSEFGGYPDAAAPARWTNSPSLKNTADYTDGSSVRAILVINNLFVNQSPSFAAGFYCTEPCDLFLFAVYIVNTNSVGGIVQFTAGAQVVWAANRGHPVRENATLSLTADGGLVLRDADGSLVWSADRSGKAVAGLSITRSGNLVLLDDRNVSVWQSFDHPSDSLVTGQILAEGMRLTPNSSASNWTISNQLYITVLSDGLYAFAESSPPQQYYSNTVKSAENRKTTYLTLTNDSLIISASSSITVANTSPGFSYIRFESDGHLRMYQSTLGGWWQVVQDILEGQVDDCAYPTVCGEYGICMSGQCTCPMGGNATYFMPIDDRRTNLGCTPVTSISCASMPDHQLVALSNISYFNYIDSNASLPQLIDEESCKKACLSNCSCKAALFQDGGDDTSKGSCYLPTQLFSLRVNQEKLTHYNSSAYLKVQITHSPPSPPISTGHKTISSGAIVGYTFAGVISLLIMIIISSVILRKRYQRLEDDEDFGELSGMMSRFTFEQLKVATEEFSKILGKGGFGSVFEGQVGEQKIAVKQLDRAGQGKKEFLAEIETIGSIHHINLVRLVGFCAEKSHRLLVYEHMSNGSLDNWIYCRDGNAPLSWHTRRSIITDVAKGLAYLHEECRQRIAHFDIKPQNILLDNNFCAKLSDFGLSKMIDRDRSQVITRMRGTRGYLAPEWLTSQFITEKVDIYSFGVVVMEIISGRKNLDYSQPEENIHLISMLQEKARNNQLEQLIDNTCDDMQPQKEEVIHMMKLAMWCLQIDCNKRPQMSVVVKVLEGTVNVESNIEFNFVAISTFDLGNDGKMASSAQALASCLSGPR